MSDQDLDFHGRMIVVTGAASGIGARAVHALCAAGAEVFAADIDAAGVAAVASAAGASAATVDVCDRQSVMSLFASLPGPPDGLLTCAGGAGRHAALDVDDALLFDTLNLNTAGFWRCAQEAARSVIKADHRGLSILHVASSLHHGPAPGLSHFAAAKAASVTLVRCLAQEWAVHGIRVNALVPGPVDTPATRRVWDTRPDILTAMERRLPVGRVGRTEDLLPPIRWLLHPSAEWITGSLFAIDGGWSVAT